MMDKISLAGDLGSGKSTVAKILIEKLGAEYYSTGAIVRSIAERRGMSVVELNHYMETHPEIDHEIDDGLRQLSEVDKLLIIDSRMAWHFTEGTFKVYLTTDVETSALRIMSANRQGEHAGTLEETVKETKMRRESEKKRYKEQYGVDIMNLSNYSVVVDTTHATPEKIAEQIISAFRIWQSDRSYKSVYISPIRLNYLDDEIEEAEFNEMTATLEAGDEIPEVRVYERDGEFFVDSGNSSAIAHSLFAEDFIPATLVESDANGRKYVKMRNSL